MSSIFSWFLIDGSHESILYGIFVVILMLTISIKYNWDHDYPDIIFEFKKKRRQKKEVSQFLKKRSEQSIIKFSPSLLRVKSK